VAGTHDFAVPDRSRAEALATALAEHGFATVAARPGSGGGWIVSALDEGPYPVSTRGHRTIDAVGRAAAAVARGHGGYPHGGARCAPALLAHARDAARTAPVRRANPGARPPIPDVRVAPAPPATTLDLTPDHPGAAPADLAGLAGVDWAGLSHAHGAADDVPGLIEALARDDDEWADVLDELCGDNLLHQGTCYAATAPALPFLARLITTGGLPAARRRDLCGWLVTAADRRPAGLLADADRAAALGRAAEAAPWTVDVHRAVGAQLPALLARWPVEPPAIRFALACLAALFPDHGGRITGEVAALATGWAGEQAGAYLRLAGALLHADAGRALRLAEDVVAWDEDLEPDWLDAPEVSAAVRAGHVLAEGSLRILGGG
jgi:hypothetical protein